ncbi:MAG: 16S rRNA (cytosine(1402)-N(4))-methyltransferase RsmH [Alphaproteobacteria bacterium]|nr:16S rRNA (cytosine(1402)-N(4))-methyltransferase RsmH [Alphaproteobacteria bacterium]
MSNPRSPNQTEQGSGQSGPVHIPVLMEEVLSALEPRDGGVYIDGTFGAGGYTRAILNAAPCTILAIDRDPDAILRGAPMVQEFDGRLNVIRGRFGDMAELIDENQDVITDGAVDGVVLDLGVSSPQLDEDHRGFSFRADGPLDMRMAQEGFSAADLVNTVEEKELSRIIFEYGDERRARRVARTIVEARNETPIETTLQLAAIVRRVVPQSRDGIDPATRTFMALRIHINDELGELQRGLAAAELILKPGGRLVVVSFHSLEDRCVKTFLRDRAGAAPRGSRHAPETAPPRAPSFKLLSRSGVTASKAEARRNPRARSARLRSAERTSALAFSESDQEGAA